MVVQWDFLSDLEFWIGTDRKLALRLVMLMREVARDPFHGIGKPELLKKLHGVWSRRLNDEHRVTYRVDAEYVHFLHGRFHYD
jgi:toxin YoeB